MVQALYSGDVDRVLQLATGYLKERPADIDVLVLAARAHLAREELQTAYDLLREALAVDPRNADVLYFFGIASGQLAAREFDRLYKLAPEGARVHQLMAQSLRLQEKSAEAASEYALALRSNPTLLDALLEYAELQREESNCDEAAALYQRAEAVKPTYEGSYGLGVCLAAQNEHRGAVERFRTAIELDAQSAVAYFGLGSSLLQLGETTPAIAALERAVRLEPRMRQAYYLLGRAYRAMGLLTRSQRAFARADELAQAERSGDVKALGGNAPPRRVPAPPKTPR